MRGPLVVDIAGPRLDPAERERLAHPLVGMVILFSRNFESTGQLRQLCGQIHALRDPAPLIGVDHEGGRVQRFREGFTHIPPMAALGRLWERDVLGACRAAVAAGFVLGAELRACDVDITFAPVLDLNWGRSSVIGDRALHADPRVVTVLAHALGYGLALAGMSNCGKHFPGHGWAQADSHHELPADERTLEEILRADAAPYGWLGVGLDAVMLAHVVYPSVDRKPAGFSKHWIGEILRKRLGFTGAVFSDDLSMQGARAAGDVVQATNVALAAGCDFAMICNDAVAVDRVLGKLQWTAPPHFAERAARLVPRSGGLLPASVLRSERYFGALRDLQPVSELAAELAASQRAQPSRS
ncbi:MAG TPA: beta-N-acetylhexosaminidase [Burkholderiaceae bacterium]|nr:beta-N-acetylhexosaminidase [Burkholderiaceae bacterium]